MPHTSSAKKRLRQGAKRRESNRAAKSAIKTQIKRVLEIAKSGSAEDLQKEYNLAAKRLDKAAAKRIVHPNMAARKKSQLGRLLQGKKK
jgi:small subunit ribosomal protein S20